jgi:hypothetical protein
LSQKGGNLDAILPKASQLLKLGAVEPAGWDDERVDAEPDSDALADSDGPSNPKRPKYMVGKTLIIPSIQFETMPSELK